MSLEADLRAHLESGSNLDIETKTYALEVQLIKTDSPTDTVITELGRVFLQLRGRDAIRWLLTSETIQSLGIDDPWRASRDLLQQILWNHSQNGSLFYIDHVLYPRAKQTFNRLRRFFIFRHDAKKYRFNSEMHNVVEAAIKEGPWHNAIRDILTEERAQTLPALGQTTSEYAIEQTRLIAHEVRNALVPVRHHIDRLRSDDAERVASIRKGVVRVLDFVDEMVATSEMITEHATRFSAWDAAQESLAAVEDAERIEIIERGERLTLVAPRSKVVRALINLLRNAVQVTPEGGPVQVVLDADARTIAVEDGGPGVPEGLRGRVFDDGYTTRAGGSGFGLAYAKKVVEETLRGRIFFEESTLGGARCVIALPETSGEDPS